MEGVVDKGTMDFSQTLSIGHASLTQQAALEKDWANTKYRILEDGSQTQYRLCVIESSAAAPQQRPHLPFPRNARREFSTSP
ncbi:hypothetical protein XANCAGTX0491_007318 [Xanthoria calcicola]